MNESIGKLLDWKNNLYIVWQTVSNLLNILTIKYKKMLNILSFKVKWVIL